MIKKVFKHINNRVNAFINNKFPLTKYKFNELRYNNLGKKLLSEYEINSDEKLSGIVEAIRRDGIAVVRIEDLFPKTEYLNELISEYKLFSETKPFKDSLLNGKSIDSKNYLIRSGYYNQNLSMESRLFKMAISKPFISIISNYLQVVPRVQFSEFWHTIPQPDAGNKNSQNWHRDPEFSMIKVFLYLNDVNESAGPFCYLKGTQRGGPLGHILPRKIPNGPFYPNENEIFEKIDKKNIMVNTGSAGTLIFCDTNGFHKGGAATLNPRVFAYWTYAGPGTLFGKYFNPIGRKKLLTKAEKFVLKL